MAKSTKKTKVETPEIVTSLQTVAKCLLDVNIPKSISDRFSPQLEKVSSRLQKIATNVAKALELEATKDERAEKKLLRDAAHIERLKAQIAKAQTKLNKIGKS